MILWYLQNYNDISWLHMLYSKYTVLFTLVDLQSQCSARGRSPKQWKFVLEKSLKVLEFVNDQKGGTRHFEFVWAFDHILLDEKLVIIPQTVQLLPCRQEDKASQLQTDTTQNNPRR